MARIRYVAPAVSLALSLCAAGAAMAGTDWPTYGFDSVRTSNNPDETILSPATVGNLEQIWSFNTGKFDVALSASNKSANSYMRDQAMVASGVTINNITTDVMYLGDNNGTFFAFDLDSPGPTGNVLWYASLPTVTIPPPFNTVAGIFGSAAIDRTAQGGAGAVYVGTNGSVHALSMTTGAELPDWPVAVVSDPGSQTDGRMHSGINLLNGQLYATTGANGSDTRPFWGRIVSIDTATATISNTWYTLSGNATQPSAYGGGIWGWGGIAIDPTAKVGGLYFATGNSFTGTGQSPLYAEQVVSITPDLTKVLGNASPKLGSGDYDYGASPTVFQGSACKNKFLAVKNKTGILVLEGISPTGALEVLQTIQAGAPESAAVGADTYRGTVAWDPVNQQILVTNIGDGPAPYTHGLTAFKFSPTCTSPFLSFAWNMTTQLNGQPITANGTEMSSPVLANGVAYFGAGQQGSYVYAVALASGSGVTAGQLLWQSPLLTACTANTTPTVVNGKLIVPCAGSSPTVHVYGLP